MKLPPSQKTTQLAAWVVMLLASALPKVILQEFFDWTVSPNFQAVVSAGVILSALLATFLWQPLRGLRPFLLFFLVLIGSEWLVYNRIDEADFFRSRLRSPAFSISMLAEKTLGLIVTLMVITALLLMKKKPADFYLTPGDIAAPAQPVRWLGIKPGDRWSTLGFQLTLFISLGTLAFLFIAGRPSLAILTRVLPFLPAVFLAAALNAFIEEVTYKASFLSVLKGPVGPRQAILLVAVYFGIAHYYGVPYGWVGVMLAAFMGWILAKSMHETGGLFWAWFIHFWQDVWIFVFMAVGSIVSGGG